MSIDLAAFLTPIHNEASRLDLLYRFLWEATSKILELKADALSGTLARYFTTFAVIGGNIAWEFYIVPGHRPRADIGICDVLK